MSRIGTRAVYLCPEAVAYLDAIPRENDMVLGGWQNVNDTWRRVRVALSIPAVNLHDLRHTFASIGDDRGYSEATVGALLGHSAASQTGRYTHKLSKDLIAAAGGIGGHVWGLLGF